MKSIKIIKLQLALVVLMVSQLACQTLLPTPQTTTTPNPTPATLNTSNPQPLQENTAIDISQFSDDEIKAGIQAALDLYAEAYSQNRPELLERSVDQENKPFRRIARSRFDEYQASYVGVQI